MLLTQYDLGCLAQASYLSADEATGTAVVVDSQRDAEQYLQDTIPHGWHIDDVFLTHFHTDFLAGHIALQDRVGATICLGAQAQTAFTCTPFAPGATLEVGWRLTHAQVRQRRGGLHGERNCRTCMERKET